MMQAGCQPEPLALPAAGQSTAAYEMAVPYFALTANRPGTTFEVAAASASAEMTVGLAPSPATRRKLAVHTVASPMESPR